MPSDNSLPVVLVTGANQGLGLEIVKALISSEQGYDILLLSRNLERGQAAAEDIKGSKKGSSNVTVFELDIEKEETIDKLYTFVEKEYGRVDYLINNAGAGYDVMVMNGQMAEREAWDKAYSLNVVSTHFFTRRFIPLLLKSSQPRLIFISSATSSMAYQMTGNYPINQSPPAGWPKAPAFQQGRVHMMALEWARVLKNDGVIVHIVDPGQMQTNFGGVGAERKTAHPHPSISAEFVKEVMEGKHDDHKQTLLAKSGVLPW